MGIPKNVLLRIRQKTHWMVKLLAEKTNSSKFYQSFVSILPMHKYFPCFGFVNYFSSGKSEMVLPKRFRTTQSYSNKIHRKFEKEVRPATPEDPRICGKFP